MTLLLFFLTTIVCMNYWIKWKEWKIRGEKQWRIKQKWIIMDKNLRQQVKKKCTGCMAVAWNHANIYWMYFTDAG